MLTRIACLPSIAKAVAAKRYGPQKKTQKDMLGSFVAHGLTQSEAESEILLPNVCILRRISCPHSRDHLLIKEIGSVAGSDTTATVIRSTLLHIVTSPRVLKKLRQEMDSHSLSAPIVTDSEARQMPYLQAVIKEGFRIFPPVAGLMSKQVPPEGDHWKGAFIPGGTRIGSCAWGIFRREDIWGDDSAEFRPERWLEREPEELKSMESALDLIFSYGRWQCLGRPVALIELNKIFVQVSGSRQEDPYAHVANQLLVKLLRQFEFSICDPTQPWKIYNCGIFSQSEFRIRVERRD